ncbi:hypothetical protein [Pelosinus baikalensis]|uniref:hypothetical protein n=1 Tax=Pelosinus baikalensis TaxID=2892015 RepID=UPI001E3E5205|nr:hypothetical protein [Pelosinus baikalensis]
MASVHPRLKGNVGSFGAPQASLGFETDGLLVRHILKNAGRLGVNVVELTDDKAKNNYLHLELDHGALVPLYYLKWELQHIFRHVKNVFGKIWTILVIYKKTH